MNPLLLVIPLVVVLGVAWFAGRTIRRYDDDLPRGAMPKSERIAKTILMRNRISSVRVEGGDGDFYAPMARRIELSHKRIARRSTSAAAIAAHEAAHAVQHAVRFLGFMAWLVLAIPSTLASLAWFPVAIGAAALDSDVLADVAFGLFGFTVAVSVVTVWVEVDASRRALRELRELRAPGLDQRGARRVLVVCGATYVADTVLDLGFVGRRLRRDDDAAGGRSSDDDGGDFIGGQLD